MQPTFQGFPRRHDERRFRIATSDAGGRQPRPQCCMLSGSLILSRKPLAASRLQLGIFKRFCFFFFLHHCFWETGNQSRTRCNLFSVHTFSDTDVIARNHPSYQARLPATTNGKQQYPLLSMMQKIGDWGILILPKSHY
jgi:hypothetical protein